MLSKLSEDSLPVDADQPTNQDNECRRIGAWNVQSMNGKDRKLIEEMRKYDLCILDVSKTKWKGNSARLIEDHYVIYSGVSEGRERAGIAVVLSEGTGRCMKSWKCASKRIVVVKLIVAN